MDIKECDNCRKLHVQDGRYCNGCWRFEEMVEEAHEMLRRVSEGSDNGSES